MLINSQIGEMAIGYQGNAAGQCSITIIMINRTNWNRSPCIYWRISNPMQGAFVKLLRWTRSNGLSINPLKTVLVLFMRKCKRPVFSPPMIDGVTLNLSSQLPRYWSQNTEDPAKRGLIALYSCKNSIGKILDPRIIKWIYEPIVRPIRVIGALVWIGHPTIETLIKSKVLNRYWSQVHLQTHLKPQWVPYFAWVH